VEVRDNMEAAWAVWGTAVWVAVSMGGLATAITRVENKVKDRVEDNTNIESMHDRGM
jgi:hypothetical protein